MHAGIISIKCLIVLQNLFSTVSILPTTNCSNYLLSIIHSVLDVFQIQICFCKISHFKKNKQTSQQSLPLSFCCRCSCFGVYVFFFVRNFVCRCSVFLDLVSPQRQKMHLKLLVDWKSSIWKDFSLDWVKEKLSCH